MLLYNQKEIHQNYLYLKKGLGRFFFNELISLVIGHDEKKMLCVESENARYNDI